MLLRNVTSLTGLVSSSQLVARHVDSRHVPFWPSYYILYYWATSTLKWPNQINALPASSPATWPPSGPRRDHHHDRPKDETPTPQPRGTPARPGTSPTLNHGSWFFRLSLRHRWLREQRKDETDAHPVSTGWNPRSVRHQLACRGGWRTARPKHSAHML